MLGGNDADDHEGRGIRYATDVPDGGLGRLVSLTVRDRDGKRSDLEAQGYPDETVVDGPSEPFPRSERSIAF